MDMDNLGEERCSEILEGADVKGCYGWTSYSIYGYDI